MTRACDFCGTEYVARRRSSRFCSTRCRQRNHARPAARAAVVGAAEAVPSALVVAVLDALTAAGAVDTVAGAQALFLAARLSDPREPSAGLAAVSKELTRVMASVLGSAEPALDGLDEITARRNAKAKRTP